MKGFATATNGKRWGSMAAPEKNRLRLESVMADTSFHLDEGLLRCGVCREFLCPPILQCKDGHYACIKCWEKRKNRCHVCFTCIDKSIRNVGLEKLVGSVKRKCEFWEHGCRVIVPLCGEAAVKHRKSCAHEPHHCPLLGCTFHGRVLQFSSHFQESHNIRTVHFSYGVPFTLPSLAPQCAPPATRDTWPMKYLQQKFVLLKDISANPKLFLFCYHDSHPLGAIFYISSFCFDPSFSSVPLSTYDYPKNSLIYKYRLRYVSDARTVGDKSADLSIEGVIMKHLNTSSCASFERMISSGAHFLLVPEPFAHLSGINVTVTIFTCRNHERVEDECSGSEEDKEEEAFPDNKKQATQQNEPENENGAEDDKDVTEADNDEYDEENVSDKEIF